MPQREVAGYATSMYTFGDALPLAGAAAPLLTAAIGKTWPCSLAQLARSAGVSKYAASRAAPTLRQHALLLVDEEGRYSFNDDHPIAPTLVGLAWRYNGIQRIPPSAEPTWPVVQVEEPFDDFSYRDLIPPALRLGAPAGLLEVPGPALLDARTQYTRLGPLLSELYGFEHIAQQVYANWRTERLRDVVHQTLHLGAATLEAQRTLRAVCGSDQQGPDDPATTPIPGHDWVRATYLVSADVFRLLWLAKIMKAAIAAGSRIHSLRGDALAHLAYINRSPDSASRARWTEQALAAAADAEGLWSTHGTEDGQSYAFLGGSPAPVDVGTAGDQILAVQFVATAKQLAREVARMAAHPSVIEWVNLHPKDAATYSLTTTVVDDVLD